MAGMFDLVLRIATAIVPGGQVRGSVGAMSISSRPSTKPEDSPGANVFDGDTATQFTLSTPCRNRSSLSCL